jgi:hypothetical protein
VLVFPCTSYSSSVCLAMHCDGNTQVMCRHPLLCSSVLPFPASARGGTAVCTETLCIQFKAACVSFCFFLKKKAVCAVGDHCNGLVDVCVCVCVVANHCNGLVDAEAAQ